MFYLKLLYSTITFIRNLQESRGDGKYKNVGRRFKKRTAITIFSYNIRS